MTPGKVERSVPLRKFKDSDREKEESKGLSGNRVRKGQVYKKRASWGVPEGGSKLISWGETRGEEKKHTQTHRK